MAQLWRQIALGLMLGAVLFLAACSSNSNYGGSDASGGSKAPVNRNDGRYSQDKDSYPDNPPDLDNLPDLVPRYEPYSARGNSDYEVLGQNYRVLPQADGFREQGIASWYGAKFHGHLTSNGETYDMYSLSAAHKNLPLPSYVRVTNLDNGKSTIVRVNDRGPFHEGRVIDLSYAAAYKLGVLQTGTGRVKLEAIVTPRPAGQQHGPAIQVAAVSDSSKASQLANSLGQRWNAPSRVVRAGGIHKIQLGPFNDLKRAQQLLSELRRSDYPKAFLVD